MRWRNRLIALTVIAAMPLGISQTALADSFNFVLFRYPGTSISNGSGINNNGQVVGFAAEAPGFRADPIGFLYDSGSFTPIRFAPLLEPAVLAAVDLDQFAIGFTPQARLMKASSLLARQPQPILYHRP